MPSRVSRPGGGSAFRPSASSKTLAVRHKTRRLRVQPTTVKFLSAGSRSSRCCLAPRCTEPRSHGWVAGRNSLKTTHTHAPAPARVHTCAHVCTQGAEHSLHAGGGVFARVVNRLLATLIQGTPPAAGQSCQIRGRLMVILRILGANRNPAREARRFCGDCWAPFLTKFIENPW